MQTTPVIEHGKYSPDEWFLCHLVDGSWRAVVASLLLELDMRWPESVAQDSTPVEKVFLHELQVCRGAKVCRCREVEMGFALEKDEGADSQSALG